MKNDEREILRFVTQKLQYEVAAVSVSKQKLPIKWKKNLYLVAQVGTIVVHCFHIHSIYPHVSSVYIHTRVLGRVLEL